MAEGTGELVTVGWAGVFISAFATYLLFRTLRESRRATAHAAAAAAASAEATKAAQESLKLTEQQLRLTEREIMEVSRPRLTVRVAQIGLGTVTSDPLADQLFMIEIGNAGERVGIIESCYVSLKVLYSDDYTPPEPHCEMWRDEGSRETVSAPILIRPNADKPITLEYRPARLQPFDVAAIGDYRARAFLYLFMEYRDHMQEINELGRCYRITPHAEFREARADPESGEKYDFDRRKESSTKK